MTTIDPEVRDYLEEVKRHLADLPEDELDDLTIDLESHLAEVAAEDAGSLRDRLGPAETYARELRATAGLGAPARTGRPSWLSTRVNRSRARVEELAASTAGVRARELWQQFRPIWVGVRGWLLVVLVLITMGNHVVFDRFPIPHFGNNLVGLALVVALTALSLTAARRAVAERRWRLADGGFTALAVVLVLSTLLSPVWIGETVVFLPEVSEQDIFANYPLTSVRNIYAYDLEGNPITDVLLFDQDGNPLDLYPWYGDGENGEVRFATDRFGQPVKNAFPLQLITIDAYDENGEPIVTVFPEPRVPLPLMNGAGAPEVEPNPTQTDDSTPRRVLPR